MKQVEVRDVINVIKVSISEKRESQKVNILYVLLFMETSILVQEDSQWLYLHKKICILVRCSGLATILKKYSRLYV